MSEYQDFDAFYASQAEISVVGALLVNNNLVDELEKLEPKHFANEQNKLVFQVVLKQVSKNKASDVVTVGTALQAVGRLDEVGGFEYLNRLAISVIGTSNFKHWVNQIIEASQKRETRNALNLVLSDLCGGMSGDEAIEKAVAQLQAIDDGATDDVMDSHAVSATLLEDVTKLFSGEYQDGIKTGIGCIDDAIPAGLENGQLIVIAGRTGMGKSALANTLALNIAQKHSVLTVSYEMTKHQLARRSGAMLGEIPQKFLQVGFDESDDNTWRKLTEATEAIINRKYYIAQKPPRTAYGVASLARKHKRKHGLDVLIVDHIGLMNHEQQNGQNLASAIGESTRQLKQLALDLGIVVILMCQINRAGAGEVKPPQLTDLRDSGRIEEDADNVFIMHRPDYYRSEKKNDGLCALNLAKVRDGEQMTVYLRFDGAYSRFVEWVGELPTYEEKTQHKPYKRGYSTLANNARYAD